MSIKIQAVFKDPKVDVPAPGNGDFTTDVYFIAGGLLYKGEYHMNKFYYAYKATGAIDCIASSDGSHTSGAFSNIRSKTSECTQWCYIDELKIVTE